MRFFFHIRNCEPKCDQITQLLTPLVVCVFSFCLISVDVQAKILEMITVLRDQTELLELTEAVRANLSANAKDLCKQIQHDLATNELDYSSSQAVGLISATKPHSASIHQITIPLRIQARINEIPHLNCARLSSARARPHHPNTAAIIPNCQYRYEYTSET
jgi:hypothetical protein